MAKQDDLYSDAVSSVTDFILGDPNRKPEKGSLKPQTGGVDSGDPLANAFAHLAAAPGLYLSDPATNLLNDTLGDKALVELRLYEDPKFSGLGLDSDTGRLRIRGSDLGKFVKNPTAFIDDVYKKMAAERKWQNVMSIGGALEVGNTYAWARKNKLSRGDSASLAFTTWELDASGPNQDASAGKLFENSLLSDDALNISPDKAIELSKKFEKIGRKSGSYNLWAGNKRDVSRHIMSGLMFKDKAAYEKFAKGNVEGSLGDDARALWKLGNSTPGALSVDQKKAFDEIKKTYEQIVDTDFSRITKHKSTLSKMFAEQGITDPAVIKSLEANMLQQYKGVRNLSASQFNGNLSRWGFRNLTKENFLMKAMRAPEGSAEQKKYLQAAGAINVVERFHFGESYSGHDMGNLQRTIANELKGATGAYKKQLEGILGDAYTAENINKKWTSKPKGTNTFVQDGKSIAWKANAPNGWIQRDRGGASKKFVRAQLDFEILKMQKVGSTKPYDIRKLQMLMSSRENLGAGALGGQYRAAMGNATTFYRNMKDFSAGNWLGSMVSGYGFHTAGVLSPAEGYMSHIKYANKDGSVSMYTNRILMGKEAMVPGYAGLTNMYYFTPGTLLKTALWNGEGIFYIAEKKRRRMISSLLTEIDVNDLGKYLGGGSGDIFDLLRKAHVVTKVDGDWIFNPNKIDSSKGDNTYYFELIEALKGSRFDSLYRKYVKQRDSLEKMGSLGHFLSFGNRKFGAIFDSIKGKWQGGMGNLLMKLSGNKGWQAAVKKFTEGKLGLYQLLEKGVNMILQKFFPALASAVGGVVGWFIATVITGVLLKISKPFIQLTALAVFGVIGLFLCVGFAIFPLNPANVAKTHSAQPPVQSIGYAPLPGPAGQSTAFDLDPNKLAICPINQGATCTQGPFGPTSHARMGTFSVDIDDNAGAFRAPSDGIISGVSASRECEWERGVSRGGQLTFTDLDGVKYRVFHVDPLVTNGPIAQGTVLGTMSQNLVTSECWGGSHYHMDTYVGGNWLNTYDWLNKLGCNVGVCLE